MVNKFIKITDKNEWQDLLSKVLFKTFFHNIEWEEFLESQFKWLKFERYLYRDLALLSLARVGNKLISHPFCEYGGPLPLVEKINGKEFADDLLNQFKNIPLKISFHPQLLKYFEGIEFPENQRETFFMEDVDKKSLTEIFNELDRNRHRLIEKMKNMINLPNKPWDVDSKDCNNAIKTQEIRDLYKLYVSNLKRHKALPYPLSFFEFFSKQSNVRIILLKNKGEIAGGNIFIDYNNITHSFLCGFDKKYRKFGLHDFILWRAIVESQQRGCQTFDFGATRKDSSIRDFKERWGPKSYPIFELKNYSEESSLRKSKLRTLFGFLPPFLIKKLSPHLLKYKL